MPSATAAALACAPAREVCVWSIAVEKLSGHLRLAGCFVAERNQFVEVDEGRAAGPRGFGGPLAEIA